MRTHLAVLLLAGLAGCAAQPRTALPDASVIAAHEWDHGPPWGPEEIPWVAPPPDYYPDTYYAGSPWYWGGPAVGLGVGIGIGRGHWWGGHRGGYYRGGGWGRGGLTRGPGFHGGGHFGGGRRGRR